VDLKERPTCIFFLNESRGWMATNSGIWRTEESGRTWTKLQKLESIEYLYFLDELHGYAVGDPKAAYETIDGGKTWKKVAAADEPSTDRDNSVYDWVVFDGPQHGFILGYAGPPQKRRTPDWVDPERARFRSGDAATQITLRTEDAGKTWRQSQEDTFGDLARLKIGSNGTVLGLVLYPNFSKYPAEVYRFDLKSFQKNIVYRSPDRVVTDVAPMPDGEAFLAAIEAPGKLKEVPIPGKLKISRSSDLEAWSDMDVDYRATAQRALLSGADRRHLWVATDTGMILKLVVSDGQ